MSSWRASLLSLAAGLGLNGALAPAVAIATAVAISPAALAQVDDDDDDEDEDDGDGDIEFDGDDEGGGEDEPGDDDVGDGDTGDDTGGDSDAGSGGDDDDRIGTTRGGDDDDDDQEDDDSDDDGDDGHAFDPADDAVGDRLGLSSDEADFDVEGDLRRSREILALDLDDDELAIARDLGFVLVERKNLAAIGQTLDRLSAPPDLDLPAAIEGLSRSIPAAPFDFNHIFVLPEGSADAGRSASRLSALGAPDAGAGIRIGVIDTLVDASHPSFRNSRLQVKDFALPGGRDLTHATAVVSILIGMDASEDYSGLLPGASVYAANVFTSEAGSLPVTDAGRMVEALDWLAGQGVVSINMSIAGPDSSLLKAVVQRLQARGIILVAAVGNEGPAAPALYPAAYPGVIGVTATDLDGNVYRRAGRGDHVDYSAPGVGLKAASPGGRYGAVTGTSFATPVVTAVIAVSGKLPNGALDGGGGFPVKDLGTAGRDRVYGNGLILVQAGE